MAEGFKVKVQGTYIARSGVMGAEKIIKNYELEGIIPSLVNALSVVKNKLLTPILSTKYPDYISYRTYHIVEITPLGPVSRSQMSKVEVQYMTRDNLLIHIQENNLPVDHRYYPDLVKLREAVQMAKDDPQAYVKKFNLRKGDLEMDLEIAKLNPGVFSANSPTLAEAASITDDAPSASISLAPALKPKLTPQRLEKQTQNRVDGLAHDMKQDGELADI